jgi:hypothetical protein
VWQSGKIEQDNHRRKKQAKATIAGTTRIFSSSEVPVNGVRWIGHV